MSVSLCAVELDEFALARVRYHARRLRRIPAFAGMEEEDLQQELILDLLKALPKFDPARASRNTFICRVIARRCLNLLRDAHRRYQEHVPLDGKLANSLQSDVRMRLLNREIDDPIRKLELADAVRVTIAKLPARLRRIARLLMRHSQVQVARRLGVSETSIDRARKQLRQHFENCGVDLVN